MAAPEVAKAASATAGRALVLKVDTEALPALSQRYNVQGIPNFIVFKEGHVAFQQAGLVRADSMVSWLPRYMAPARRAFEQSAGFPMIG